MNSHSAPQPSSHQPSPGTPPPAFSIAARKLEQLGLGDHGKFELFYEKKSATKIDSKDQKVDSLSKAEDVGLSIRVIKDKRLGFSYTTSLDRDAIHSACETAVQVSSLMEPDEYVDFYSFSEAVYPDVDQYDPNGLKAPLEQKIALAHELEALCRAADPRIRAVRSASVNEVLYETHLMDTHGEHIHHRSTTFTASIYCKAEENGDSQMGGEFAFSPHLDSLDIKNTGKLGARWATELLGATAAPTMVCPAVLRNSVVAELIEFLSSSFSGEEIDKGRSMLASGAGKPRFKELVFSEKITLIDDGLHPGGMGTSPFDGEGVPSQKNILIDGGFFTNALYDLYQARKQGKDPTGSSSRSIKSPPLVSFSNLYMKTGRATPEKLMDGITQGILITDLMGVHTANPVTGDFSLGASGILIENGRLTRPVRGFAVAGNVLGLFKKMTDIGTDLRFFGTVGAPSVRVSELSVGGS